MSIFEQRKQAFENFEVDLISQINLSKNDKHHIFHSVWGNKKNQSSKTIIGNVFKIMFDEHLKLENDNTYESSLKNLLSVFALKYVHPAKVETAVKLTMELLETQASVDVPAYIILEAGDKIKQSKIAQQKRTSSLNRLIDDCLSENPKASAKDVIKYLKGRPDPEIIDEVSDDYIYWINHKNGKKEHKKTKINSAFDTRISTMKKKNEKKS